MKIIPLIMLGLFFVSAIAQFRKRRQNRWIEPDVPRPLEEEDDIDIRISPEADPSENPLHHPNSYIREKAVIALGKTHDPAAIPDLLGVLDNDKDYSTISKAGEMLVQFGQPIVPDLLNSLRADSMNTREVAARTLGDIGHASAVDGLRVALKDVSIWVRRAAAEALGKIKSPAAIEGLEDALDDDDETVREAAAEALKQIGTPKALKALALNDDV